MSVTEEKLRQMLEDRLNAQHVVVKDLSNCNCGEKFDCIVVSDRFEGKPTLQRHRMVNTAVKTELEHIHALTIKTFTPTQWETLNKENT